MYKLVIENLTKAQAELLATWLSISDGASNDLIAWWCDDDNPDKDEPVPIFSTHETDERNKTVTIAHASKKRSHG